MAGLVAGLFVVPLAAAEYTETYTYEDAYVLRPGESPLQLTEQPPSIQFPVDLSYELNAEAVDQVPLTSATNPPGLVVCTEGLGASECDWNCGPLFLQDVDGFNLVRIWIFEVGFESQRICPATQGRVTVVVGG